MGRIERRVPEIHPEILGTTQAAASIPYLTARFCQSRR